MSTKVNTDVDIETRILHLLKIYPVISPTMLQSGLGPSTKPAQWRPVLVGLIKAGVVLEETQSMQTPSERYNTYTKLSLPGTTVLLEGAEDPDASVSE